MDRGSLLLLLSVIVLAISRSGEGKNVTSRRNLVRNGSFESFAGNGSQIAAYVTDFDMETLYAPSGALEGWSLTQGRFDWGKRRWPASPDGTPASVSLSGVLQASFNIDEGFSVYTLLLDVAGRPNITEETLFSLSVSISASHGSNSSARVLNSTSLKSDPQPYDGKHLHWRTIALAFNCKEPKDLVTLSLTGNGESSYGPLIDNVRVYPGHVSPPKYVYPGNSDQKGHGRKRHLFLIPSILAPSMAFIALLAAFCIRRRTREKQRLDIQSLQERMQIYPYKVIKGATRNFHPKLKLGEGGFGAVYKGVLPDGTVVAVKQLAATSYQGQAEFLNEITLINRVQHRNLVTLKGCSIDGKRMLLVYEFLENRSLHQALLDRRHAIHIDWATRVKIAVGTARGLVYMHEDSQERIIHRDIKASNILLDKNFNAKISDFGLAKIFDDDKTHVTTRVAGTLGYLAPEYALRGQLTEKADVFSFGILSLELVSGRINTDTALPAARQFLLDWTWRLMEENRILDLVDSRLGNEYEEEEAKRLILTALWCTQLNPNARPPMSHVLSMILGRIPLDNPPSRKGTHTPAQYKDTRSGSVSFSTSSI